MQFGSVGETGGLDDRGQVEYPRCVQDPVLIQYNSPRFSFSPVPLKYPLCKIRFPFLSRPASSAYVSIRQHTSSYVIIRQYTPAYVIILQHTPVQSAYCSMRQRLGGQTIKQNSTWLKPSVKNSLTIFYQNTR